MVNEIWMDIDGYPNYMVSNLGEVKSLNFYRRKKAIILSACEVSDGYRAVTLYKNNKRKSILVHRLVANAFISNPYNKRTVNHINGIKSDNRLVNLEWATYSENTKHAQKMGLKNNNHCKILVLHTLTGIYYNSIKDAAIALSYKYGTLRAQLNGQNKNRSGLIKV